MAPPVEYRTAVPALYARDDRPGSLDYSTTHPQYGPVGGHIRARWADIHQGWSLHDHEVIDRQLRAVEGMTVTLASGEEVPRPVLLTVAIYSQLGADFNSFADHSPEWLKDEIGGSYMMGSNKCSYQPAPRYNDETYQTAFEEMIAALGAKYSDNPRITAVTIGAGYDDETAATRLRKVEGCRYSDFLYRDFVSKDEYEAFVTQTMLLYRQAFPDTPLYIQAGNAEWKHREVFVEYGSTLNPPIGYKPNVLAPDLGAAYGWASSHKGRGFIQVAEEYRDRIPLAYEPKAAPYQIPQDERRQHAYWMTLNALAHDADFIVYQSHCATLDTIECSWFPYLADVDEIPDEFGGFVHFVTRNLGQSPATASDAWIVLRDSEFENNLYVSGEPGDWHHLLYRVWEGRRDPTEIVWSEDLPDPARQQVYGRQLRQIKGEAMLLDVDDAWQYHQQLPQSAGGALSLNLHIWYLDHGTDRFAVTYRDHAGVLQSREISKQDSDQVTSVVLTLPDLYLSNQMELGADLRLDDLSDGEEALHMVLLTTSSASGM